ncbi:MAG: acyl-CoA thioesterase [Verrucomicrobia bacterium]|nr:acyl-CoA thioesterase [Verrucomicrobiota bacterium]
MAAQTFVHTHRVTYSECTVGNHVYYARYLDLLEEARNEFFRALGHPLLGLQESGTAFFVSECHLHYRALARYDHLLRIEMWVEELGRVRLTLGSRVSNPEGKLVLEATTVLACASCEERPKPLPPELVKALEPFVAAAPPRQ